MGGQRANNKHEIRRASVWRFDDAKMGGVKVDAGWLSRNAIAAMARCRGVHQTLDADQSK
jgi:hypothetical protein